MIRELMQYIVHVRPYIFTIGIIVAAGTIKIRFGIIVKADFIGHPHFFFSSGYINLLFIVLCMYRKRKLLTFLFLSVVLHPDLYLRDSRNILTE